MKAILILVISIGLTAFFVAAYVMRPDGALGGKTCYMYIQASKKWCGYSLDLSLRNQDNGKTSLRELYIDNQAKPSHILVNEKCHLLAESTIHASLITHQYQPSIKQRQWSTAKLTVKGDRVDVKFPSDFKAPTSPGPSDRDCLSYQPTAH